MPRSAPSTRCGVSRPTRPRSRPSIPTSTPSDSSTGCRSTCRKCSEIGWAGDAGRNQAVFSDRDQDDACVSLCEGE
jgi:hypothetical protein